jgi:hypothetical protein
MKIALLLFLPLLWGMIRTSTDEIMEKELAHSLVLSDAGSHSAVKLLYNIFLEVTKYECHRQEGDCAAWKAVNIIEALELLRVNCDEHAKRGICKKARKFLGLEETIAHEQVIKNLLSIGKGVPTKDYPFLNAIRDSVINFVCRKEPEECAALRYVRDP